MLERKKRKVRKGAKPPLGRDKLRFYLPQVMMVFTL